MFYMQINIDKMIDNHRCPEPSFCEVATTVMDKHKRENTCYHCWLDYCHKNKIEIIYI